MNTSDPSSLRPLELRRLFLLAPDVCPEFTDARVVDVGRRWQLTHQADLQVHSCRIGERSLTLIGYLLDADRPDADDQTLLESLCTHPGPLEALLEASAHFGGRWALIADEGERTLTWNDATGQRPLYYHRSPEPSAAGTPPPVLLAGEPGLIARRLGLPMDPEAVDFVRSRGDSNYEVYWMPGDSTLYREVQALLPNHCLDLRSGRVWRWWPSAAVPSVDYDSALQRSEALLRGQMEAARRRWPLSISMTAGWDSRLMLALCRPAAADLHAFTLTYPHLASDSRDVRVPARLLTRLGLVHHVFKYPLTLHEGFKAVFRRNHPSAARGYCADAQALWEQYPQQRMCVNGDVAEIVKCHYRLPERSDEQLVAQDLADLLKMGHHPFALECLQRWLDGARRGRQPAALPLLDLFCWEQMAGRWQATIRAEYDIVQDAFPPLNHRGLLLTMLGVDETRRSPPGFELFHDLIRRLWPETLSEPINPPERQSLKNRLIGLVGRTGVLRLIPPGAKQWARKRVA